MKRYFGQSSQIMLGSMKWQFAEKVIGDLDKQTKELNWKAGAVAET